MTDDFNSRLSYLSFNAIQSIYEEYRIIELNNILEGFKSDFFTIALKNEKSLEEYTLIYIGGDLLSLFWAFLSLQNCCYKTCKKQSFAQSPIFIFYETFYFTTSSLLTTDSVRSRQWLPASSFLLKVQLNK